MHVACVTSQVCGLWVKLGLDIEGLESLKKSLNAKDTLSAALVNALIKSLITSDRTASAVAVVQDVVSSRRDSASSEDTYLLVLTALA